MANDLTGDFDVVAEFAIPAANRLLAAVHRSERFLHSLSIRVDDNPRPSSQVDEAVIVGSEDVFGEATVDHTHIGTPIAWPGSFTPTDPVPSSVRDSVVNTEVAGATVGPVVPSKLQGRAQLQLSPPTIEVGAGSGASITARLQMMSRYFPDPQTPPVSEFVRGELRITAGVNQVTSPAANVVEIDVKADNVHIGVLPSWSSQPLSAEDVAGVTLLIRNALKTSFLPSSISLPSTIRFMRLKTLHGAQSAIGVLLNLASAAPSAGTPGDPGSVSNIFLGPGDDFAFAAGRDFVLDALKAVSDGIRSQPIDPVRFDRTILWHTFHIAYTISLTSVTVDLEDGNIVLTIDGHAHTGTWWLPDFDFRARQPWTLSPSGATAELVAGELSLDITTGGITGWLVSRFKGRARVEIARIRDASLETSGARATIRRMLSADENLGQALKSLLSPARGQPQEDLEPALAYSAVDIRRSGIVLHGSLAVPAWPPVHVEFEQIPTTGGGGPGGVVPGEVIVRGPDYSALKSWIPGGVIQRYEWSSQGQAQPFLTDDHTFVLMHRPPEASTGEVFTGPGSAFTPICLTVRGERLSSSGPVVAQPISATVCGYTSVSVIPADLVSALQGTVPLLALTQPGPRGVLEVTGHTPAPLGDAARGTPNLIVHFADEATAARLELLTQALRDSRRGDAATVVLAVLSPDQLAKARYTEGVIYADDHRGTWERAFGLNTPQRPVTLIAGPSGKVVWQHDGELDRDTLTAALRRLLVSGGPVRRGVLRSRLRIGQSPPNFLFEHAPGRELTLRKLAGRPALLVFWKSASKPSIQAVRDAQETTGKAGAQEPAVLAINDGDAPELAKRVAAENALSATLVADPERHISRAYGVNAWPTTAVIDEFGLVREIRYGRVAGSRGR